MSVCVATLHNIGTAQRTNAETQRLQSLGSRRNQKLYTVSDKCSYIHPGVANFTIGYAIAIQVNNDQYENSSQMQHIYQ